MEIDRTLIIHLVRQHAHLYDRTHQDFKDFRKKEKSWDEISSMLNISVEDCQREWKNLRDRYVKMKRYPANNSSDSSWVYHDMLSFLDTHIRRRRVFKLRRTNNDIETEFECTSKGEDRIYDQTEIVYEDLSKSQEETTYAVLDSSSTVKYESNVSTDDAFANYVARRLKEMPPELRRWKRRAICELLEDESD